MLQAPSEYARQLQLSANDDSNYVPIDAPPSPTSSAGLARESWLHLHHAPAASLLSHSSAGLKLVGPAGAVNPGPIHSFLFSISSTIVCRTQDS